MLFGKIAKEIGAECSYVNRAFEYAAEGYSINLYGSDKAHTSPEGAYLIICTNFASLYGVSSAVLGTNGIDAEAAKDIQKTADKISLEGIVPWGNDK